MIGVDQLKRLWSNLLGLGTKRLATLGVVGAIVFSVVSFGGYYISRPQMETLYAGLSAQDVSRIGAALKEAGIPFDVNAQGNAVLVRYGQTAQARMLLAEKSLPSSANAGYELFDKMGSMGLTSFMQEITRVRALEGEIARTIQLMKGVKAARVHIVMPEAGSFRRTRQAPSASVIIRTEVAGDFSSAPAIRHLVAAAIPGMALDQVAVLNTEGAVLAAGGDLVGVTPGKMVSLEKTVSKELQEGIAKALSPYLGIENFEISVAARLNTDKRQVNETAFNPESKVERSVRVIKEAGSSQNANSRTAVGVEQNLPVEQAQTASGDQSKKSNERREELTNYEVSSKTTSTVSEGYKIESLAIAVVVNRRRVIEALGQGATPEAISGQLKEVEQIASSAAGLDAKRGDRITVAAVEFIKNSQLEPVPPIGFVEHLYRNLNSIVFATTFLVFTALLLWFGVRPGLNAILHSGASIESRKPLMAESPAESATMVAATQSALAGGRAPNLISDLTSKMGRSPQKRLEQMIDFDEEQAAAILKQWVREARA